MSALSCRGVGGARGGSGRWRAGGAGAGGGEAGAPPGQTSCSCGEGLVIKGAG